MQASERGHRPGSAKGPRVADATHRHDLPLRMKPDEYPIWSGYMPSGREAIPGTPSFVTTISPPEENIMAMSLSPTPARSRRNLLRARTRSPIALRRRTADGLRRQGEGERDVSRPAARRPAQRPGPLCGPQSPDDVVIGLALTTTWMLATG